MFWSTKRTVQRCRIVVIRTVMSSHGGNVNQMVNSKYPFDIGKRGLNNVQRRLSKTTSRAGNRGINRKRERRRQINRNIQIKPLFPTSTSGKMSKINKQRRANALASGLRYYGQQWSASLVRNKNDEYTNNIVRSLQKIGYDPKLLFHIEKLHGKSKIAVSLGLGTPGASRDAKSRQFVETAVSRRQEIFHDSAVEEVSTPKHTMPRVLPIFKSHCHSIPAHTFQAISRFWDVLPKKTSAFHPGVHSLILRTGSWTSAFACNRTDSMKVFQCLQTHAGACA